MCSRGPSDSTAHSSPSCSRCGARGHIARILPSKGSRSLSRERIGCKEFIYFFFAINYHCIATSTRNFLKHKDLAFGQFPPWCFSLNSNKLTLVSSKNIDRRFAQTHLYREKIIRAQFLEPVPNVVLDRSLKHHPSMAVRFPAIRRLLSTD